MRKIMKKVCIVFFLAVGIVVSTMIISKEAYAPNVTEKVKVKEKVKTKDVKKSEKTRGYMYVKCPHCGKKIKVHVSISK